MRNRRNRRRGRFGAAAAGPVLAVPVPVGGRWPVEPVEDDTVDGDGFAATAALASAGVGGSGGICEGEISFEVGAFTIGGCGTPATSSLRDPGRTVLSGSFASAKARYRRSVSSVASVTHLLGTPYPQRQCCPLWLPLGARTPIERLL